MDNEFGALLSYSKRPWEKSSIISPCPILMGRPEGEGGLWVCQGPIGIHLGLGKHTRVIGVSQVISVPPSGPEEARATAPLLRNISPVIARPHLGA